MGLSDRSQEPLWKTRSWVVGTARVQLLADRDYNVEVSGRQAFETINKSVTGNMPTQESKV